jgi:hypothetical protein
MDLQGGGQAVGGGAGDAGRLDELRERARLVLERGQDRDRLVEHAYAAYTRFHTLRF